MKTLLQKLTKSHTLTFVEMSTVLTEVEAILNSRPLTSINSTDVDAPLALTPGHFLIGRSLKSLPGKESDPTTKMSTLARWNLTRRLVHDLWIAWKGCYLQSLQSRNKWQRQTYNFQPGDVVLLKDEAFGLLDWPMAKVLKVYPGDDGHVRVVDLLCQGKEYRRSTNRLILLTQHQPSPPVCLGLPSLMKPQQLNFKLH